MGHMSKVFGNASMRVEYTRHSCYTVLFLGDFHLGIRISRTFPGTQSSVSSLFRRQATYSFKVTTGRPSSGSWRHSPATDIFVRCLTIRRETYSTKWEHASMETVPWATKNFASVPRPMYMDLVTEGKSFRSLPSSVLASRKRNEE